MLTLQNVSLSLDNKELLKGINLSVKPGELVVLVGPNGAGKSSLFKTITGEYKLSQGEIKIDLRPRASWPAVELAAKLAVLPQHSLLNFPFTVEEVVHIGRISKSTSQQENQIIVEKALLQADVLHLADQAYTRLSGGEKQRVHFARVLAQVWETIPAGNRYLLLDEPTSALDLSHQHQTLGLAKEWAGQGVGVLVVLHDLNLAARYADRVIMLSQGEIVADGSPWEVLSSEQVAAVFGLHLEVMSHPNQAYPVLVA